MLEDEQKDFFKAARQRIGQHLLAPIPEKQVWLNFAFRAVLLIGFCSWLRSKVVRDG